MMSTLKLPVLISALILLVMALLTVRAPSTSIVVCRGQYGYSAVITSNRQYYLVIEGTGTEALNCIGRTVPFYSHSLTGLIIVGNPSATQTATLKTIRNRYPVAWQYLGNHPQPIPQTTAAVTLLSRDRRSAVYRLTLQRQTILLIHGIPTNNIVLKTKETPAQPITVIISGLSLTSNINEIIDQLAERSLVLIIPRLFKTHTSIKQSLHGHDFNRYYDVKSLLSPVSATIVLPVIPPVSI